MKNKFVTCLLVILVILLLVIAFLAGMLFNQNKNADNQVDTPKTEVNTPADTQPTPEVEEKKGFSKEEAVEALQRYLDLYGTMHGSPVQGLKTMGLINGYNEIDGSTGFYAATRISFDDFMKKINDYMTTDWFNMKDDFGKYYKNENGTLYVSTGAASGLMYEIGEITETSENNFTGKVYLVAFSGDKTELTVNFTVAEGTGINKCVVDNCETFR